MSFSFITNEVRKSREHPHVLPFDSSDFKERQYRQTTFLEHLYASFLAAATLKTLSGPSNQHNAIILQKHKGF